MAGSGKPLVNRFSLARARARAAPFMKNTLFTLFTMNKLWSNEIVYQNRLPWFWFTFGLPIPNLN
jgi:hypothetical protein